MPLICCLTMERSAVCVVLLCLVLAVFNIYRVDAKSVFEDKVITKDKCIVGKNEYSVGEQWSVLGECNIYTCQGAGSYSALTCPAMALPDDSPCTFTEVNLKKMYPKCCPQLVCPQE